MADRSKARRAASGAARRPRWRWALVVLAVLGLGGGAVYYWWTPRATGGGTPRLVVDRELIDAGRVPYGQRVHAVFTLANAGTAPLRIVERPSVTLVRGC